MRTFIDLKDREWRLTITVGTVRQVKEAFDGLNLIDLADEQKGLFTRVFGDIETFVNLLFFLCREQAETGGLTDVEFGEGLAGDVLLEAQTAFLEALTDFFPNQRRRDLLRRLIAKVQEIEELMIERGLTQLQFPGAAVVRFELQQPFDFST